MGLWSRPRCAWLIRTCPTLRCDQLVEQAAAIIMRLAERCALEQIRPRFAGCCGSAAVVPSSHGCGLTERSTPDAPANRPSAASAPLPPEAD